MPWSDDSESEPTLAEPPAPTTWRDQPRRREPGDAQWIPTRLHDVVAWANKWSLFPYPFATACCALEYMSALGPRYDVARYGAEFQRFSPRQADLLFIVGTICERQAPVLRRVYDQMVEPKWVIAFGVCACTGGFYQNYSVTPGADQVIPVDVYIPGCPPRPEQVIDGIVALQRRITDYRTHAQRELGPQLVSWPRARHRLPVLPDGTSMTLGLEERMPKDGRTR